MNDLCNSFPPDMSGTFQAYAQSASFTNFLHKQYGSTGLVALFNAYGDGLDCENGAMRALGSSLGDLEVRWRREVLGEDPLASAAENLLPFFIVFVIILVAPIWNAFLFGRQSK